MWQRLGETSTINVFRRDPGYDPALEALLVHLSSLDALKNIYAVTSIGTLWFTTHAYGAKKDPWSGSKVYVYRSHPEFRVIFSSEKASVGPAVCDVHRLNQVVELYLLRLCLEHAESERFGEERD